MKVQVAINYYDYAEDERYREVEYMNLEMSKDEYAHIATFVKLVDEQTTGMVTITVKEAPHA